MKLTQFTIDERNTSPRDVLFLGDRALIGHGCYYGNVDDYQSFSAVLADGAVRATGFLALFYAAVLFTEGIGVYMQQRWAELLMIFATASLIPIELRHLLHRPGLVGAFILLVNCFIVWFLYRVLKRDKAEPHIAQVRELVETV